MGNNHTTWALPCLKTKHTAANSPINAQHALIRYFINYKL
jgi:endonuclease G